MSERAVRSGPPVATVRQRPTTLARVVTLIAVIVPPLSILSILGIWAGVGVSWLDVGLFVALYFLCGLGITVGFHRLFSHKSFRTSTPVKATFAILGSMTLQGPVTQWVTDHRKHHALSDREGDPHSPHGHDGFLAGIAGLWHAHVGWLVKTKGLERGRRWGRDLYEDPVIRVIDRLYFLWVILSLGIPYAIGFAVGGPDTAFQAFVWAGLFRIFLFDHVTWSVNSICHTFGERPYETGDESRNVWVLAVPTMGEAWHNNHHAFPGSAVHGIDRGQVDISAAVIRALAKVGLIWDVKVPTPERRERRLAPAPAPAGERAPQGTHTIP